jgi:hypothetical protein
LQEQDADLTLTAIWIRGKFLTTTIERQKVTDEEGTRFVTQAKDGSLTGLRDIWICDPEQYVLGKNVIRFAGVYQVGFLPHYTSFLMKHT